MTVSAAIQILPKTETTDELIRIVDEVIAFIAKSGLSYYVGPFETTVEGDSYDTIMQIVSDCSKIAIEAGCEEVSAYIKTVYKPEGGVLTIDEKTAKHHH
ncbi:MAG: thiamine-binding protein [Clostridia bacterium]|nr:thiamine-binding protein [Clostridia bacterium]